MDSEDCDTPTQDGTSQEGSRGEKKRSGIRRWTEQEHELLVQLVDQLGEDACWATIAEHIPGRTGKQCRERWVNHIGSDIRKGNWTAEEEDHMARLHAQLGPAWTRIATLLGGRTENSVKNHFNALLRSKRLNDKKSSILAQYVRIVRDKTNSGLSAYQEAIMLAAAADETHSQHSQPSSKSKRGSQATASLASHSQQTASQRSVPGIGGSPLASCPSIGMNGLPGIRTGRTHSGVLQHATSFQSQGSPITKTPMSRALDPASAVAAAVAAVQVAAQAVGAASGVPAGGANYLGHNNNMGLGSVMLPDMAMGLDLGAGSEGMTDSAQYSNGMVPGLMGPMGNMVPTQSSLSGNLALGPDPFGARNSRHAGRAGGGLRPGYGQLQACGVGPDGLTGLTDGDEHFPCPPQDMGCVGENNHLQQQPLSALQGQYAYLSATMEGGGTSLGRAQGSSPLSHASNKQFPAQNHAGGSLLGAQGNLMSHCSGVLQQDGPHRPSHMSSQVAQLAGMLRHPTTASMPAAGPGSGTGESKLSTDTPMPPSLPLDSPMLGQAGEGAGQGTGVGQRGSTGSQAGVVARQSSLHNSPRVNQAEMSAGSQPQVKHESHDRMPGSIKQECSPRDVDVGTVNPGTGSAQQQPHAADVTAADAAAPSAASLTLGLQDLIGQNGYNSVFGNPQNVVELGSPLSSPVGRAGGTKDHILSGNSVFGNLPGHTSYDLFAAALQTEGSHDPAILGRLSGLSLDAMMSGQLGRNQSVYLTQGGMKASQGFGMLSQQCVLTPYQGLGSGGPHEARPGSTMMLRGGMDHNSLEALFLGGSTGGGQPVAPIAPGSSGGGFGFDPSLLGDGLDLNLRPLQVRTRQLTAPGDHAHGGGGSGLPSFIAQDTLASGAKLLNGPMQTSGHMLHGIDNGTPTASALNELLFAWGQEPCTPANAVLNMPGQGPSSTGGPSQPARARLGQSSLPTVPEGVGGVFDYGSRGVGDDPFSLGGSTYQANNPLHQMFRPIGFSLDGANQIEVPPPEVMGALEIMFDDDDVLEEAAAAAGTFQPDGMPSPPGDLKFEPQMQIPAGLQRGTPPSAHASALHGDTPPHLYGPDGKRNSTGQASTPSLINTRSCHLDSGNPGFTPAPNMLGSGPGFSLSCSPNLNPGAAPPDVTPTLMAPALGLDGTLLNPHMANRVSAQRQLSLKGGGLSMQHGTASSMIPTSGPAAAAAALWAGASQPGGPSTCGPAGSGPSPASNTNKRTSAQIWGDAYSPGHSSAKRSNPHTTSSPGDPEPALGLHPLKSNLASRRLNAWAAANDPYRCTSEPGLNGGMQQLSADSTGTPHVQGSVHSSPVVPGQARRNAFGATGSFPEPLMVPVGPIEHGQVKPINTSGSMQGRFGDADSVGAASMMEAGMDAASALAWSTVFQQPSMVPQPQPMPSQQLRQYGSAIESQQYSNTTLLQLGSTVSNQPSTAVHMGSLHGSSKLMVSSARGSATWQDGLGDLGLHNGGLDLQHSAC